MRLVYSIVLSLMLVVAGALLMIACVNIYKIGNRPFTPENISNAFSKIAIPLWITVALAVIGVIAAPFLPAEKNKVKAIKDKKITLAHLQTKLDVNACSENTLTLIKKEQKTHTVLKIAAIAIVCAAAIPALVYSFNFNNFDADYNASVIAACLWILPCTFVAMGVSTAFLYLENACIERQIGYVKSAFVESQKASLTVESKKVSSNIESEDASPALNKTNRRNHSKLLWGIRIALIIAAIALIIAGILNGGMADVLSKAINICTECIGLG